MRKIVFDIETVGVDFDQLDQVSQAYMMKFADTPQKIEEVKASTSFYPLTAQVVVIAMEDTESGKAFVYFQNGQEGKKRFEDGCATFVSGSEEELLKNFWRIADNYDQLISFNGRMFDGPFLMLRSAMHRIRTSKNLLPYRYSAGVHIDLADQLSFYDAMRRRFPLHMWCRAFGIPSPKEEGITGSMVKQIFSEGKYLELGRYCLEDVRATLKLFQYWEQYLRF